MFHTEKAAVYFPRFPSVHLLLLSDVGADSGPEMALSWY